MSCVLKTLVPKQLVLLGEMVEPLGGRVGAGHEGWALKTLLVLVLLLAPWSATISATHPYYHSQNCSTQLLVKTD